MMVAVDTNVFLDVLRPNPQFVEGSKCLVEEYARRGQLVICPTVYAELAANFVGQHELEDFLSAACVSVDPMEVDTCFAAGRAWRMYRDAGGARECILPDFLIGAHALAQTACLLTRDRGFYRSYFPALRVVSPA